MGEKSLDRLYIGNRSAGLTRAFIQFATMPTIPEGSTITSATMTLHLTSGTSTAANASAYMVTGGEWTSGTIQWSNMPAANVLLQGDISHNNVTGYTFSCLTAVQAWYNGDPTGQHNNYGIMLKYANESVADYNAVYSADYTDGTKRPKLTIIYEPPMSSIALDEGESHALTAPNVSGTLAWTSANTSVATVNASGVVTGVKAGETEITVKVDGIVHKTYTVYVTIEDGVYYIRSVSAALYLGTYGATEDNTPAKLLYQSTDGNLRLRQLWRISYLGDGYYSIRPMHKLDMGLHVTDNRVDITTAGTTNSLSGVPMANRWGIEVSADGSSYCLNYVNTSSLGMKPEQSTSSSGTNVTVGVNSGSSSSFSWALEMVSGIFLHNSDYEPLDSSEMIELEMGGVYTSSRRGITCTTSNVSGVTWSSNNSTVISVNQASGAITTNKRGNAAITVSGQSLQGACSAQFSVESIETIYVKNYYDGTLVGETTLLGYISNAVDFLNKVYRENFHIKYVMEGTPQRYTYAPSATDSCARGATQPCNDSCNEECLLHHKNLNRIAREANGLHTDNRLIVLWSNSDMGVFCVEGDSNNNEHTTVGAYAAVCRVPDTDTIERFPVVQVLLVDIFDKYGTGLINMDQEIIKCILAHEVAHTLNLPDMYDIEGHVDASACIMNEPEYLSTPELVGYIQAGSKSAFCPDCYVWLQNVIPDDVYEEVNYPIN